MIKGACQTEQNALRKIADIMKKEMPYRPQNQAIRDVLQALVKANPWLTVGTKVVKSETVYGID